MFSIDIKGNLWYRDQLEDVYLDVKHTRMQLYQGKKDIIVAYV